MKSVPQEGTGYGNIDCRLKWKAYHQELQPNYMCLFLTLFLYYSNDYLCQPEALLFENQVCNSLYVK